MLERGKVENGMRREEKGRNEGRRGKGIVLCCQSEEVAAPVLMQSNKLNAVCYS
jgi:hypothetical protein